MTIPDMVDKKTPVRMRSQIDDTLKRIYDDITKEEVPERFRILLEQLRNKTAGAPSAAAPGTVMTTEAQAGPEAETPAPEPASGKGPTE